MHVPLLEIFGLLSSTSVTDPPDMQIKIGPIQIPAKFELEASNIGFQSPHAIEWTAAMAKTKREALYVRVSTDH